MVMINSGGAPLPPSPVPPMGPMAPLVAEIADNAEPGSMDESYRRQREAMTAAELNAKNAPWHDPESPDAKKKPHWIEIELIDEQGKPVAGEHYRITLPDGTTLAEGTARHEGARPRRRDRPRHVQGHLPRSGRPDLATGLTPASR